MSLEVLASSRPRRPGAYGAEPSVKGPWRSLTHLVSEMYDPFAYLRGGYRFQDHLSTVSTLLRCWLSDNDIRLIAIADNDPDLLLAEQLNPSWFVRIGTLADTRWTIDGVSAPKPPAADCEAARSASR